MRFIYFHSNHLSVLSFFFVHRRRRRRHFAILLVFQVCNVLNIFKQITKTKFDFWFDFSPTTTVLSHTFSHLSLGSTTARNENTEPILRTESTCPSPNLISFFSLSLVLHFFLRIVLKHTLVKSHWFRFAVNYF